MELVVNSIKADVIRIFKKRSFIAMMAVYLFILVGFCLLAVLPHWSGGKDNSFSMFVSIANIFQPYLLGIPVFLGVFNDDFSSRAMQTAIGRGMSRTRLVISKIIEFTLLIAVIYVFFGAVIEVIGIVSGVSQSPMNEIIGGMSKHILYHVVRASICMIVAYAMQSGTFALVIYIIMSTGLVGTLLSAFDLIPFFKNHDIHFDAVAISNMLDSAIDGAYWKIAVIALCYIVLPICLTICLFRKKELEF